MQKIRENNAWRRGRAMFRQKGVTILMVLLVGMSLLALAVILMSTSGESKTQIFQIKEKYQSLFLARGGQQHALLKFRLLPTEFYDAAAFSIGKNPYFDFTRKMNRYNNPGPMFFTGSMAPLVMVDDGTGNEVPMISRGTDWAFTESDRSFQGVMATHLNRFLKDIRSDYPEGEGVIRIQSEAHTDLAMGPMWRDPFSGSYFVDRVFIFGSQGSLSYSTDSVLVSCKGIAQRAGQVSILPQADGEVRNLTRQYLKLSTQQAGSGFKDQVDMDVSNQDKYQFLKKYEADLANPDPRSSARGEAVTAIYEVRRE
jgi:hypothetical protein